MKKASLTLTIMPMIFFGAYNAAYSSDTGEHKNKTIVHIDSYHKGYQWSDGIINGVKSILKGTDIELKVFHMDTKRNASEEFKTLAGLRAKNFIEQIKPDIVIVSDDNASKYLAMPYLKNTDLPVVYCGISWDPSRYGYPYKNSAGMIELDSVDEMIRYFNRFTKGNRTGYLAGDTYSDRIVVENWNEHFFNGGMKIYLVKTFHEFKDAFLKAQKEVDRLIINNNVGISDWDQEAAIKFCEEHAVIPTSTTNYWVADMTLFATAKLPEEQGSWAANTAIKILQGTPPSSIPTAVNKLSILTVNIRMARKLGVFFNLSDLERARIIR